MSFEEHDTSTQALTYLRRFGCYGPNVLIVFGKRLKPWILLKRSQILVTNTRSGGSRAEAMNEGYIFLFSAAHTHAYPSPS